MTDNFLLRTGIWFDYLPGATFSSTFPLLYGPVLLLFTQSLIYTDFSLTLKKGYNFLPFAILFFFSELSYQLQPSAGKLKILLAINSHHLSLYFYLAALAMIMHFSMYSVSALTLIKKYHSLALNKFSTTKTNLHWLASTILFFQFIFLLSLINNVLELTLLSNYYSISLIAIIVLLSYFIIQVVFKALRNPELFSWMEQNQSSNKLDTSHFADRPDKSIELNLLVRYMEVQKPFLDPDLTVENLAKGLMMHPKEVSRLMNEHLKQNFFDFVNRYRILEAQALLINSKDPKITVLEIIYQVGFNSKSSFNTLFKKYTGITPTEFKRQHHVF